MSVQHGSGIGRIFRGTVCGLVFFGASSALWSAGSISFSPPSPNVEQTVTFTLTPPCSFLGSVQWTFGDGGSATGGTTVTHKYLAAGTFNVVARVNCDGNWTNTSTKVAVKEERKISFSPAHPGPGTAVTFHAENFLAAQIKWNFGDGTIKNYGSAIETHAYSGPGTYTVTATDFNGSSCCPVTATVVVSPVAVPSISYAPASPQAGETVALTALNFSSTSCIRWNFGDGTIEQDTTPPQITHVFASSGTYTVRAYDHCGATETASTSVFVGKAARFINYGPSDPRAREDITFRAVGFSTDRIKWDFGDGTVLAQGTDMAKHAYENPGLYTVQAWDNYGQPPATSLAVSVSPDLRLISYAPTPAVTDKELTFTAAHFRSSCIRWEFGDGTTIDQGTVVQTHTYRREGPFTVTAHENCGKDPYPKSISLRVLPSLGPRAPFSISFIQLRFEDGKGYREVPKNFQPLRAFADIKFEGSGLLQGDWLVDGQPFRPISETLTFARDLTIDSGLRPPLPTDIAGPHEVSLRLTQPAAGFQSPVIRYYVSAGAPAPSVSLALSKVEDLEGRPATIQGDRLSLEANKDYLLTGTATNVSPSAIGPAILRIYVGAKLIDQKRINRLNPGEPFTFETSMLLDTAPSAPSPQMNIQVSEVAAGGKMLGHKTVDIGLQAPGRPAVKPDLCIESLTTDKPYYGTSLTGQNHGVVTVVVKNRGGSDITTTFQVRVEYCRDIIDWGQPLDLGWDYHPADLVPECYPLFVEATVPGLMKGQTYTITQEVTFGYNPNTPCALKNPPALRYFLRGIVDWAQIIDEQMEQNNTQTTSVLVRAAENYDPALDQDGDGWMTPQDCDDQNPAINPCGLDVPQNGLDEDCLAGDSPSSGFWIPDESLDAALARDWDMDGFPASVDCDDYNSSVHPGTDEIPGDGRDNNCNRLIDEPAGYNWQVVEFTATRVGYTQEDIDAYVEWAKDHYTSSTPVRWIDMAKVQGRVRIRFDHGSQPGNWTLTDSRSLKGLVTIRDEDGRQRAKFDVPASLLETGGEHQFDYILTYAQMGFSSISQGNAVALNWTARVDPQNIFPQETSESDNALADLNPPGPFPILVTQYETVYNVLFADSDGGYTHGGAEDEWEYGVPPPGTVPSLTTPAPLHHFWATDLDGYYENNCNQWLESPSIPIAADMLSNHVTVGYWANFASGDKGLIEVWQGGTKILEEEFIEEISGKDLRFIGLTLPTSSYGHNIKFRFRVKSDGILKKEGLYLSQVQIAGDRKKEI